MGARRKRKRPAEPKLPRCSRCRSPLPTGQTCYECQTTSLPESEIGMAIGLEWSGCAGVPSISVLEALSLAQDLIRRQPAHTAHERRRRVRYRL